MPFADKFYHFQRMFDLIRRKATGTPKEFAQKLNVSKAQFYRDLDEVKALGLDVRYNPEHRSFEATSDGKRLFL